MPFNQQVRANWPHINKYVPVQGLPSSKEALNTRNVQTKISTVHGKDVHGRW